jgi:predicted molibdopterin-dependent oxidoreductase YjgC
LGSARCTNEDNYLLMKLARRALGTNNVDFSPRVEALPGLYDLPQYRHVTLSGAALDDLDRADAIVMWQTDLAQEHPAAAARIIRAAGRGVPVIDVGVRSGQLGHLARVRLSPRPGTGAQLAAGLLHLVLSRAKPGSGEAEMMAASVAYCTPERTETVTGVPSSDLRQAGEALADAARRLVVCNRAATLEAQGADLLMSLAALGRSGNNDSGGWPGLLWLSHYSNFQGARDMGVVPHLLTGYQAVSDAQVSQKFARAWGRPLPTEPGLAAWEMLGQVRGLFIMGDDPARALPDTEGVKQALSSLEFLVVQDIFLTPAAEAAHVVLPGASFAEKDGTFTSAERRIQRVRKAIAPPGQARADWEILCELSSRMGQPMHYASPARIMDEIAELTPLYAGISYQSLEQEWGRCWSPAAAAEPGAAGEAAGRRKAESISVGEEAGLEVNEEFPLLLVADYDLGAWADDAMVAGSVALRRELGADRSTPVPVVEMSPGDAQARQLREGQRLRVRSQRGEMEAAVHISPAVCSGVVVLPFRMRGAARSVMPPSTHRDTGMPLLPPCAVSVEKV